MWQDCERRGVFPVLCGGSGLYVESILKAYRMTPVPENPELRNDWPVSRWRNYPISCLPIVPYTTRRIRTR